MIQRIESTRTITPHSVYPLTNNITNSYCYQLLGRPPEDPQKYNPLSWIVYGYKYFQYNRKYKQFCKKAGLNNPIPFKDFFDWNECGKEDSYLK